ncbi:hypothetical protein CFIMG_007395RA00001 [Ceratocystis fimbriata CBS 114723]|uniref:Uncharacterized protein n=1 Tax=Ceratocystis fimbriata CBS 114723 TaxID=1035309 RepID=A0A2C5WY10_9PEZI|nr:hypothetical protein CFIMG_007395RA00001 [Ceratocystis fimbriata CBS 114723]
MSNQPSSEASNALIYVTYSAFLVLGVAVSWVFRDKLTGSFYASNRTQSALPLALNFMASGEWCSAVARLAACDVTRLYVSV